MEQFRFRVIVIEHRTQNNLLNTVSNFTQVGIWQKNSRTVPWSKSKFIGRSDVAELAALAELCRSSHLEKPDPNNGKNNLK
jgi:hypothetical protein